MTKIPLTVDRNYAATWGVFEGARELVANAKDADEDGHPMTVVHFPRTSRLEITTKDIFIDPSKLLILGKSDKTNGLQRGRFGEGFLLGVLALVRKGHDVRFINGEHSWSCSFEQPDEGHPFYGNELLTFRSRKIAVRELDFKVEIDDIPTTVWNVLKPLFLFLDPPKSADAIEMSQGTLLLHPDRKGQLFARGIFVRKFEDLECGYDMKNLELDRDRREVDSFRLRWQLGELWQEACQRHPGVAAPKIYEMAKANSTEVRSLHYHADAKLLKSVRDRFEAEHTGDAAPVTSMAAAKDAESVGATPVVVSETLKELLEKSGLSSETVAARLDGTIDARFSPSDLTPEERNVANRLEPFMSFMAIVSFRGTKEACRLIDGCKLVGIERRMLTGSFRVLLASALTAEAKRRGVQVADILLDFVAGHKPVAVSKDIDAPTYEDDIPF